MKSSIAIFLALLGIFSTTCAAKLSFKPNPCPIPSGKKESSKCKEPLVCGVSPFWKRAYCVKPPVPDPACSCVTLFDPVCCRAKSGYFTVTQTESNDCFCGCIDGEVLFKGSCNNPPNNEPCPKILKPVCCYISKFDLTYTAGNECICEGSGGIFIGEGECKH